MRADRPWLPCLLLLAGCYASNVVAPVDRAVRIPDQELAWRPAADPDFRGLFGSIRITGDAAVTLRRVWYMFELDGRYTGTALIEGDDGPEFQTLRGRWRLAPEGLLLDDGAPILAEAAPEHLRLAANGGCVLLRREAEQ